ncbi:MAG: deoxyribodipyrimidine photolyase [Kofleriaceae bacterium]
MDLRVTAVNQAPVADGDYVLYWMIAARRTTWSFALDHAIAVAKQLGRPLLVFEPLRADYRWASDRFHTFVMQGMADNARRFAAHGVTYLSYVEPARGAGKGLLAALAARACCVVTDEQPGFFLPRMVAASALTVRLEQVDGNGLLPLRAVDRPFATAMAFRRELQHQLGPFLAQAPRADPLARLPRSVKGAVVPALRWRSATSVAELPIDHTVAPVADRGGSVAAGRRADDFFDHKLARYQTDRNNLDDDPASGLSPYLHFGHISAHELVHRVWAAAEWSPAALAGAKVTGRREGWWGLPAASEAVLDELVTWRELGYVCSHHDPAFGTWNGLPAWARKSLLDHANDPRPERYTREQLQHAETADPIWNAAQRQLVGEGRIHNYLRMLWGKKILEWSPTPQVALATLIELNNTYSVDGRDPNSSSGICWTLGQFDRPWGPIRPIFGTVRYMSSASTKRKLDLASYLTRWSGSTSPATPPRRRARGSRSRTAR